MSSNDKHPLLSQIVKQCNVINTTNSPINGEKRQSEHLEMKK